MKIKHLLAIFLLFAMVPAAWAMEEEKPEDGAQEEVAEEQPGKDVVENSREEEEEEDEEEEATDEKVEQPGVTGGTQETPAPEQPQEETHPNITHNDIAQYLWFHLRHFFSIEQDNGQFRNITSQELLRLWNDLKSQGGNLGKVFSGEANQNSPFSIKHSFFERLGKAVQVSWQSKNVRGALAGTGIVTALDFLLTNLTTWEKESHKNLMKKFESRSISFKPEENSRVLALVFYSFLATMGARLGDHDADINRKNLIEILVKVAIGSAAGSLTWNSLRRYIFGKGSDFSTNVKKSLKFALLCTVALGSGNLTAGQLANK